MLRQIRSAAKDIQRGDNIDLYLTIGVGILLATLNLFGLATSWASPITLAVLALLAFSTLVNRQKLESVLESVGQSMDDIFVEKYPLDFEQNLRDCEELWIVGINLRRTITTYYALLEEKIKRGHSIRILLLDPDGKSADLLAGQARAEYTPEEHRALIRLTLSNFCSLKSLTSSNVEIRVIDYPTPYGFFVTNPGKAGTIYMKLYPFKMENGVPIIVFKHDHEHWYEFYRKQVLTLWNSGSEWKCGSVKK